MINHTDCDHPRTSSARAKCRRAKGGGKVRTKDPDATPKKEWGGKAHHDPDRERNTGQVPRDRDKQCDVCGVERILAKGTDPLTGILIFVGERCSYMVERQDDFEVLP